MVAGKEEFTSVKKPSKRQKKRCRISFPSGFFPTPLSVVFLKEK